MTDLYNYSLRRTSGTVSATMHAHSPQHLSEWAELIGAELPDEYAECEYQREHGHEDDHNSHERKRKRECGCEREYEGT